MSEINKNNINENINKDKEDQNLKINKEQLLKELSSDIAEKYKINGEKTTLLIKKNLELLKNNLNNSESLKKLKIEISESFKDKSEKEINELVITIKGALELIENSSKIEISTLKKDIEKTIDIKEFEKPINKYLPDILIEKAQNPSKPHEHILGFALGTADSAMITTKYLFKVGEGIAKIPYHLYMIVSGKAKTESFKDL